MAKGGSERRSDRARLRSERRAELEALARLMADPAGRRWVRNFLAGCNVWDTAYATNAVSMAFRAGERFQGLKLQSDIAAANFEAFLLLQKEYFHERPAERDPAGNYGDDDDGDGDGDATGFAE